MSYYNLNLRNNWKWSQGLKPTTKASLGKTASLQRHQWLWRSTQDLTRTTGPWPRSWGTCLGLSSSVCKVSTSGSTPSGSVECRCACAWKQKGFPTFPVVGKLISWQWVKQVCARGMSSEGENQTPLLVDGYPVKPGNIVCFKSIILTLGSSRWIAQREVSESKEYGQPLIRHTSTPV